ncbi:AAA family ATPase [Sphingomonas sp. 3-13AW]|uniref:AAA family ATPase n=1 Tax=Sphingomonas sp. 3-13AW TaxID=3050450 RepID=UPI003BB605AD
MTQSAIEKIALQLALEGMSYTDALTLVDEASLEIGLESAAATDLAERAYVNRNSPVPAPPTGVASAPISQPVRAPVLPAAPAVLQAEAATGSTQAQSTLNEGRELLIASHSGDASPDGLPGIIPEPVRETILAAPNMGAPAVLRYPTQAPAEPLLGHTVAMKHVTEVMPWLEGNSRAYMFNFEIPVVSWEGGKLHPRIPKKIRFQYNLPDLHAALYALATNTVTNLVGPTACGKTELVKQIGVAVNMPVTLVPMDAGISRNQLIGQRGIMPTPHGPQDVWRDGIIARALQEPGIILFDEVDRGAADIHYAIHSVYTGDGLTLLDDGGRVIPMHEMNRVFTTSNTKGRGSFDGLYQASEEMTEATRRRLTQWVEMDYQSKQEDESVLEENFPGIDEFAVDAITTIAAYIREQYKGALMSQSCSLTDQIETARRYAFLSAMTRDETQRKLILADCVRMIMANRANEADKSLIETNAATKIGVNIVQDGTPFLDPAGV